MSQQNFLSALFDLQFSKFQFSHWASAFFALGLSCLGLASIYAAIKWSDFVLPLLLFPVGVLLLRGFIEGVVALQQCARYLAEQTRKHRSQSAGDE